MSLIQTKTRPESRVVASLPEREFFDRNPNPALEELIGLAATVGDGIYGMDLDGKFSFINPAAAKMLGYDADELHGKDIHELIHHSHADGIQHSKANCPILLGLGQRENVRICDDVFWRKDGTTIPVECCKSTD